MIGKAVQIIQAPERRSLPPSKAARYVGCHVQTLKKLTDEGLVKARWNPYLRRREYFLEDLNDYLERLPYYDPRGGNPTFEGGNNGCP